jgi:hypothetical protein
MNNIGIRHLCLATDQDVTFAVPAVSSGNVQRVQQEDIVENMMIASQPFQLNLETVYLFIACKVSEPYS